MTTLHLIILGLVQGLTEYLPVSSSAHLILLPTLAGWKDQGIVYDIAVHAGSLGAVMLYFRRDVQRIVQGGLQFSTASGTGRNNLLGYLVLATVPVGVAGLLAYDFVAGTLRNPRVIAAASIFFGVVLWGADKYGARSRSQSEIGWRDALLIGIAQALAIIPGTSRSGITITAGLMLGLDRQSASRFSFLLAMPVIILATAYETYKLTAGQLEVDLAALLMVTMIAFISALLSIHFFLKLLDRTGMLPYVIYRILLGLFLFALYIPA